MATERVSRIRSNLVECAYVCVCVHGLTSPALLRQTEYRVFIFSYHLAVSGGQI